MVIKTALARYKESLKCIWEGASPNNLKGKGILAELYRKKKRKPPERSLLPSDASLLKWRKCIF
jgi:hypothetical protein